MQILKNKMHIISLAIDHKYGKQVIYDNDLPNAMKMANEIAIKKLQ